VAVDISIVGVAPSAAAVGEIVRDGSASGELVTVGELVAVDTFWVGTAVNVAGAWTVGVSASRSGLSVAISLLVVAFGCGRVDELSSFSSVNVGRALLVQAPMAPERSIRQQYTNACRRTSQYGLHNIC